MCTLLQRLMRHVIRDCNPNKESALAHVSQLQAMFEYGIRAPDTLTAIFDDNDKVHELKDSVIVELVQLMNTILGGLSQKKSL